MSVKVIPTAAVLGAEIWGVDLARPLEDATFGEIERAFNAHAVIFFRDQRITPPQQVAFTRRFGEIEFNVFGERWSVPGSPEIVVVSNATEDDRPIGVRRAGENWHSDMCYTARPPRGTMLYALEIPDLFGLALGDTEFASAAEAWEPCPSQSNSGSTGDARCSISVAASAPFHPPERKSTAFRRSGTRSSGRIPKPGANACTSCVTIALASRAWRRKKRRR